MKDKKESIFKVKLTEKQPFCAVGIVHSIFQKEINLQATGTLITPKHVLTTVSNVYNLQLKLQASQVYFYAENASEQDSSKKKIKVKKINYSPKYLQSSIEDKRNYQLAVLQLENNTFIKKQQCLSIHWNWKRSLIMQNFMLIGYPSDRQEQVGKYNTYNQFMFNDKLIAIYDNWIKYGHQLSQGTSGAPILIQQKGQFFIIGIHLGVMPGNIRFGILFSNQLQNSFNVLKSISKQYKQIQQKLMIEEPNQSKLQQRILQLEMEVKSLKEQKQLMRLQLQKMKLK